MRACAISCIRKRIAVRGSRALGLRWVERAWRVKAQARRSLYP
jgi:hypothetical protein